LAHYLKALGVLRLVGSQLDPGVRGYWRADEFWLVTTAEVGELVQFFTEAYAPTPLVAPWNGGSGFYTGDNQTARTAIETSPSERFASFKHTIEAVQALLSSLGLVAKPATDQKPQLLQACRGRLPDAVLPWLDAAFVITSGGAKYPPLLGTGGNDGRLEFSNNYMQRLTELIDATTGQPTPQSESLIRNALFGENTSSLDHAAVGQFLPGNAGGMNSGTGFSGDPGINPWDFVLMLEGALVFAAASVRRLGDVSDGGFAYPFTVRSSGVGYGSAASSDESGARGELWVPLWGQPASLIEVTELFSEGRARMRGRVARNGLDFAQALATLGVDRGIESFQRYGFHKRNGLSYFATPLNRIAVRRRAEVDLLAPIEAWLERLRIRARTDNTPGRVTRAVRLLDDAVFQLCLHGDALRVLRVFKALGGAERALAESLRWTIENRVAPIPALNPTDWLAALPAESSEMRLAMALASTRFQDGERAVPLRVHLERSVPTRRGFTWLEVNSPDTVWHPGSAVAVLLAIFERRILLSPRGTPYADGARRFARLQDVTDFIAGHLNEAELMQLLWAYSLLDWAAAGQAPGSASRGFPGALYALIKGCFPGVAPHASHPLAANLPALTPAILRRAAAGDARGASSLAARRLLASGARLGLREVYDQPARTRRVAAAAIFPVAIHAIEALRSRIERDADPSAAAIENPSQSEQPQP